MGNEAKWEYDRLVACVEKSTAELLFQFIGQPTKKCSGCQMNKDYSFFSKEAKSKDGLQYYCKTCRKQVDREYYLRHTRGARKLND